jgi:predicted permease
MQNWPFYLRWAVRSLARRPLFTGTVTLLLALAIGSNTAVFTLLNAVLYNPVPVAGPGRLVSFFRTSRGEDGKYTGYNGFSYADTLDLKAASRDALAGLAYYAWNFMDLSSGPLPERVTGMYVSADYFPVLGVAVPHGRGFTPEDEGTGSGEPVAILSDGCAGRLFAGDPRHGVGRVVRLNGHPVKVVGVAAPGFKGTELTAGADIWVPATAFRVISPFRAMFEVRGAAIFQLIGRLRPGISRAGAEARLKAISAEIARAHKLEDGDRQSVGSLGFLDSVPTVRQHGTYATFGRLLGMAVGLILGIAGLNVAFILLLRGVERRRELAIAQAVGAGRGALLARLLWENALLFLLGGALSLPVGYWTLRALWSACQPEIVQGGYEPHLDGRGLAWAFALTLASALLFGVAPALQAARTELMEALRGRAGRRQRLIRPLSLMVMAQVAVTACALIGAGILLKNLQAAWRLDPGFPAASLVTATLAPSDQGYDEARSVAFFGALLEKVRALPGVRAAGMSENRLLRGAIVSRPVIPDGQTKPIWDGSRNTQRVNVVMPGFFDAVGIRLAAGRDFSPADCKSCRPVAIVNRALADRAWPGQDPVGKLFHFDEPVTAAIEVVGVTVNTKVRDLHEPQPVFFVYRPLSQQPASAMTLHVRSSGRRPEALVASLRRAVAELDPNLPLADVGTMSHFVEANLWQERILALLFSFLGGLALLLASVGIYGVMAFRMLSRRQEIALRIALGAPRGRLLLEMVSEAALVAAAGVAVGAAAARYVLSPLLTDQIISVGARDPAAFFGAALLLWLVAMAASLWPAHRGVSRDPLRPLRS